jgi:hypothetical protein
MEDEADARDELEAECASDSLGKYGSLAGEVV